MAVIATYAGQQVLPQDTAAVMTVAGSFAALATSADERAKDPGLKTLAEHVRIERRQ